MFKRPMVRNVGGLVEAGGLGDGWSAMPNLVIQTTDSNQVIAATAFAAGIYYRTGQSTGRTDTTDSAVNILAALEGLGVGEVMPILISNQAANVLTIGAGAGVSLLGKQSVPSSGSQWFLLTKTSATTLTLRGL